MATKQAKTAQKAPNILDITLGSNPDRPKRYKCELQDGVFVELQTPTVFVQNKIDTRAMKDQQFDVWNIIFCTYKEGTDELVFSPDHYQQFMETPDDAEWLANLRATAYEMIKARSELVVKKKTQTDSTIEANPSAASSSASPSTAG